MWFLVRTAVCVTIVFSMAEGQEATAELARAPAALAAIAPSVADGLAGSALSICTEDPKFCMEAARRFAGGREAPTLPSKMRGASKGLRLVADTLTLADRATPWRGSVKATAAKPRETPFPPARS